MAAEGESWVEFVRLAPAACLYLLELRSVLWMHCVVMYWEPCLWVRLVIALLTAATFWAAPAPIHILPGYLSSGVNWDRTVTEVSRLLKCFNKDSGFRCRNLPLRAHLWSVGGIACFVWGSLSFFNAYPVLICLPLWFLLHSTFRMLPCTAQALLLFIFTMWNPGTPVPCNIKYIDFVSPK